MGLPSRPSFEEWLATLSIGDRARATALLARFTALGAPDAESWVRSEIRENIAQLARFRVLRRAWRENIDAWATEPLRRIEATIKAHERHPKEPFADAGPALRRMTEAGVDPADIAAFARMIAYDATCGILNLIDDGLADDAAGEGPGWVLMEAGSNGRLTGRVVGHLNESILAADPSGREGRPR